MAFEEETTGVANMTLLDNCDNRILVENLKKRLQKDLIYVSVLSSVYYSYFRRFIF